MKLVNEARDTVRRQEAAENPPRREVGIYGREIHVIPVLGRKTGSGICADRPEKRG